MAATITRDDYMGHPRSPEAPDLPKCHCGHPAATRTVKKNGPNFGKNFFACVIGKDRGGCDFFRFEAQPEPVQKRPRIPQQYQPPADASVCVYPTANMTERYALTSLVKRMEELESLDSKLELALEQLNACRARIEELLAKISK
jgi:hypothetical protein